MVLGIDVGTGFDENLHDFGLGVERGPHEGGAVFWVGYIDVESLIKCILNGLYFSVERGFHHFLRRDLFCRIGVGLYP